MKVETFKQQNRIVIHTQDGWAVLVSYQTPVAARDPEGKLYRTSRKWSTTTSRHVNQWLSLHDQAPRNPNTGLIWIHDRGQEFFDTLLHARTT